MKILFLDIDGVLNNHGQMMNLYCGIDKEKVNLLNWVIDETDCKIVISSAWRYTILCGEMTVKGFEYMLLSHGLKCHNRIIGCTASDEEIPSRGKQIADWLINRNYKSYIVVDDLDSEIGIEITKNNHKLVKTDGKTGLTKENCDQIVKIFEEEEKLVKLYHEEIDGKPTIMPNSPKIHANKDKI